MSKKFALVIPLSDKSPKSFDMIDALLGSIVDNKINEISEVIACWDNVNERLRHTLTEKYSFMIPLVNEMKNLNYSKNSNKGLRLAHKELKLPVLLCNQDCELPSRAAIEFLTSPPTPSVVSPMAVNAIGPEPKTFEFTETKGTFSFHCPFISLEVMDAIGYINPGTVAFSDDDYLARTKLAGFKTYTCNVPVVHKGSFIDQAANNGSYCGTYDGERLNIDHMRFRHMYCIPEGVPHAQYQEFILQNFKFQPSMKVN